MNRTPIIAITVITALLAACGYTYPGDHVADGAAIDAAASDAALDGRPPDATVPDSPAAAAPTIAFTSDRAGSNDILTMRVDGSLLVNLTNNAASDTTPLWSPAGDRIAFLSNRSGTSELYVMNADGSGVVDVSRGQASDAAGLPDGAKLAFTSNRSGADQIYRATTDGAVPVPLTSGGGASPDWASDGSRLAFVNANKIYVMSADGSGAVPITSGVDREPRWRPDRGAIAYAHRVSFTNFDVFVVAPDGTNPTNVSSAAATTEFDPRWSRDAQKILMTGGTDVNTEIELVNADGTGFANLSMTPGNDAYARWSPDGTAVSFTSGNEVLVRTLLGGTTNVTDHPAVDGEAVWRPTP